MRSSFICLMVGSILPCLVGAQCPDKWVQQISPLPNGTIGNAIPSMVVDIENNVIVSNLVYNAESVVAGGQVFDEFASDFVNTDIFIAKYSSSGDFQWLKKINGVGLTGSQDLATDDVGNIYASGYFSTSLMIEDSLFTYPPTSGLGYFIMKLDPAGEMQWFKKSSHHGSVAYCIQWTEVGLAFVIPFADSVLIDGQMFYAGTQLYSGAQDVLFGILDAVGQLTQSSVIGGEGTLGIGAMVCNSTGCLIQGRFEKELTLGNLALSTPALDHYSLYQLFIGFDGEPVWGHATINPSDFFIAPFGLGSLDDGTAVFAAQYLHSGFELDGHSVLSPISNPNKPDVVVGKLDLSDGSLEWLKKMEGDESDVLTDLSTTGMNALVVGGSDSPLLHFDGYQQANSGGFEDGYAISIDMNGKPRCGLRFHGSGQERVRQVHLNRDGSLFALLSISESLVIDNVDYYAQGAVDLLLVKTCLPCDTTTSIKETAQAQSTTLQVYPNPFTTRTQLNYRTPQGSKAVLQLTDMLGRVVQSVQLPNNEGTYTLQAATLGTGIYFCSLVSGVEVLATEKLVVSANKN